MYVRTCAHTHFSNFVNETIHWYACIGVLCAQHSFIVLNQKVLCTAHRHTFQTMEDRTNANGLCARDVCCWFTLLNNANWHYLRYLLACLAFIAHGIRVFGGFGFLCFSIAIAITIEIEHTLAGVFSFRPKQNWSWNKKYISYVQLRFAQRAQIAKSVRDQVKWGEWDRYKCRIGHICCIAVCESISTAADESLQKFASIEPCVALILISFHFVCRLKMLRLRAIYPFRCWQKIKG